MSKLWRDIIKPGLFPPKDKYRAKVGNDDITFPWSIYGDNLDIKDHKQAFDWVNHTFKLRIAYPLIRLMDWLMQPRKRLRKKIRSEKAHDHVIDSFNRGVDKGVDRWIQYYVHNGIDSPGKREAYSKRIIPRTVRLIKRMVIQFCLNDDAYRELLNSVVLSVSQETSKLTTQNGVYVHVPYMPRNYEINDIAYMYVTEGLRQAIMTGETVCFCVPEDGRVVVKYND